MQLTLLNGYPDYIGKRFAFCGSGTGPKSYVQKASGGDPISVPRFQNYVDVIFPALSLSGTDVELPVERKQLAHSWTSVQLWAWSGTGDKRRHCHIHSLHRSGHWGRSSLGSLGSIRAAAVSNRATDSQPVLFALQHHCLRHY